MFDPIDDPQTDDSQSQPEAELPTESRREPTWEERLNGAKGEAAKHRKKAERLEAELNRLRQETLDLVKERDKFKTDWEATSQQATQAQTELTRLQRQSEIGKLIRTDFKGLTDLYEEGLLRGLEGLEADALTDYLKQYNDKITARHDATVQQSVSGAKPPPPSQQQGQSGLTLAAAQAEVQRTLAQHGSRSVEYGKAMENYLAVVRKG